MKTIFRGRLVAKNQMTIPLNMQRMLGMERGDELEFDLADHIVTRTRLLKPLPIDLFPPKLLAELRREREAGRPSAAIADIEEWTRRAATGDAKVTYRGRLVGKGQMTVPLDMQRRMGMERRDELEFSIEDERIVHVQLIKPMPIELLTPELQREIRLAAKSGASTAETTSIQELAARGRQTEDVQQLAPTPVSVPVAAKV